jgi:hypothetical protein
MTACSSLCVELWQTILRYSIGVADFLDPDAFEGVISHHLIISRTSSTNNEQLYWCAEKRRNRLQLVSKSWDLYLRCFEHRFVRLLDIRHKTLEPETLEKAIRVSFGKYGCQCDTCLNASQRFEVFGCETIDKAAKADIQIVDMKEEDHQISDFIEPWRNFDTVRAFIAPNCGYCGSFAQLVSKLTSLRHFYGKGYRGTKENGTTSLSSQTLVTLSLHDRMGSNYAEVTWNLPSLRHLRFKDDSNEELNEFVPKSLLPLLRAVGGQLLSLYLYNRSEAYDLPTGIWELCPRVGIFRTSMSVVTPPPYFHPIHTLVVYDVDQLKEFKEPPEWPNLRKVVVDRTWERIPKEQRVSSLKSRPEVRVEDRDGVTAEELDESSKAQEESAAEVTVAEAVQEET